MDAAQRHIADQWGQRGSQQRHGSVFGKGFFLIAGIQPSAQDDGPDIEKVFPEEGEACHESHLHDGEAVVRISGKTDDADGHNGHQPGIHQRCAGSCDEYVVGNQQILHGDNLVKTLQDLCRRLQKQTQQDQPDGKSHGSRENISVTLVQ